MQLAGRALFSHVAISPLFPHVDVALFFFIPVVQIKHFQSSTLTSCQHTGHSPTGPTVERDLRGRKLGRQSMRSSKFDFLYSSRV